MRILSAWLVFCIIAPYCVLNVEAKTAQKIEFWNQQRKGANFFNKAPTRERFKAGRELGLQFVRLAPDKWEPADLIKIFQIPVSLFDIPDKNCAVI